MFDYRRSGILQRKEERGRDGRASRDEGGRDGKASQGEGR